MTPAEQVRASISDAATRGVALVVIAYALGRAWRELYDVAWGTGGWVGELSFRWAAILAAFTLLALLLLTLVHITLWRPDRLKPWKALLSRLSPTASWVRLGLGIALLGLPVWFLQYTHWGLVFDGLWLRLLLWSAFALPLAALMQAEWGLGSWQSMLAALLVLGAAFSAAAAFTNVTSHPFSLGWSEGNRLWDYSMLFGRRLYDYPVDQPVDVLLDVGRQFIGGLPFLLPGLTILQARFWLGLTVTVPYVLLGLAALRSHRQGIGLWFLGSLWTLLFLKQGPIHPPLVFCAIFTALLWGRPLWLAAPLIALTGYAAVESRFTWVFAPGIWIAMLEFGGAGLEGHHVPRHAWVRAITLGVAGALGGYLLPKLVAALGGRTSGEVSIAPSAVAGYVGDQPLLWYRLLPNATYGAGILTGLLMAAAPLALLLLYLTAIRAWRQNGWQRLAVGLPLMAFLAVGLFVSVKIGGGGDLHNLDMFLIGMFFAGVIALRRGGARWLQGLSTTPLSVRALLFLLVMLPAVQPLLSLRTIQPTQDRTWLVRLTDSELTDTFDLLPPKARVETITAVVRTEVAAAAQNGDVLFIDQRQLLTFGEITGVPFVPEYEKKILMNDALTGDPRAFTAFYRDLRSARFSLIVSEPLRAPTKDSTFQFGEENNAWVKFVVNPLLCYYAPKETFKEVQVSLLVPTPPNPECAVQIPELQVDP